MALVALPPCTLAEELGQEKENAPAVVRYAIANDPLDRSTWRDADDFAQGERICFAVVGSLPEDVDRMRDLSYRLVAELASGHTYVEGSATVWLVGMDGSARDVTNNLAVDMDGDVVVAGASNLTAAIPGITDTDELVLAYDAILNQQASYGFAQGNVSMRTRRGDRNHMSFSPSLRRLARVAIAAVLAVVCPLRPSVAHEFSRPVFAGDAAPGKVGPSQARADLRQGCRHGHAHVPKTRTPDGVRASSSRSGKLTRQLLYRH